MNQSMKSMVRTAMMTAIIFICTYTFKIPIALTGGYTHLGDCAIFIGVMLLGRKNGALAAAIGASLSDLLGGFIVWVIPTFVIKGVMALIMGSIAEKVMHGRKLNFLAGAVLGGIWQVAAYTAVKFFMISPAAAVATIPTVSMQTVAGITISAIVIGAVRSSKAWYKLKEN